MIELNEDEFIELLDAMFELIEKMLEDDDSAGFVSGLLNFINFGIELVIEDDDDDDEASLSTFLFHVSFLERK